MGKEPVRVAFGALWGRAYPPVEPPAGEIAPGRGFPPVLSACLCFVAGFQVRVSEVNGTEAPERESPRSETHKSAMAPLLGRAPIRAMASSALLLPGLMMKADLCLCSQYLRHWQAKLEERVRRALP